MAWARAMTTSWQDVSLDRPQTTRTTPSTHTLSSIWDEAARDAVQNGWLQKSSVDSTTPHGPDSERQAADMLVGCKWD